MTIIQSDLMRIQAGNFGKVLLPSSLSGRVRLAHGMVKPAEPVPVGSRIELVSLPKLARVLPTSQIHFEGGQSPDLVIKAGDRKKADRYLTNGVPGVDGISIALDGNKLEDYTLADESVLFLTNLQAELAANRRIVFDIFYVVD